jgi:hypothetical protein
MLLWVAVEEVLGAAVADQHSGNKPHETRKNQKQRLPENGWAWATNWNSPWGSS